jgi:hypothetical protein
LQKQRPAQPIIAQVYQANLICRTHEYKPTRKSTTGFSAQQACKKLMWYCRKQ